MDPLLIGLRAQDFHEGLKTTATFGAKEVQFRTTLLIGKAASLAMHLRGLSFVDDYPKLEYAAASLGIGSIELPAVLRQLEAVDFVSVVGDYENIKRIDVRVPEFRSGYSDLGQRWLDLNPGEVERAGIQTLDKLCNRPVEIAVSSRDFTDRDSRSKIGSAHFTTWSLSIVPKASTRQCTPSLLPLFHASESS